MGLLDYDLSPQQLGLLGAAAAAGNAYAPQPASRLPLAKPNLAYTLSQMAGGLGQGYGVGLQDQLAKQQAYAGNLANLQNTGMYNLTAQALGWPTMPMPQGTGLPGMPGMPSGAPAATGSGLATANAPPIQVASAQGAAPPVGVSPPPAGGGAPSQAVYSPPRLGNGAPPSMDPDLMRRMILAKAGVMPPLSPTQINLYNAGHDPFDRSDSVTREALDAEARKGTPSLAGDVKLKETLAANEQEQGPNGSIQPMQGSVQSAARKASAVAGATKAAETANSPASLVTLIGPNGDAVSLDQNRQAAQIDKLVGSGGYRVYNQQTPTETTDLDVDKGVRKEAIAQQTAIGRQRQTLDIARSIIQDPSFKSGKWQDLSAPARAFLSDLVPNLVDKGTVTTQQAYESALARLTFQEAPTLNVKTVRGNMLPLMEQVQGALGQRPEANRAAILIGTRMADWDLKRIDAIGRAPAPRAAQVESQFIQDNPVATEEFKAGLNTTMNPDKLIVPKLAGEHEFYDWYQEYKGYWSPQQRAAAQQVMRNFDMGKNTTGQTFSVGAPK